MSSTKIFNRLFSITTNNYFRFNYFNRTIERYNKNVSNISQFNYWKMQHFRTFKYSTDNNNNNNTNTIPTINELCHKFVKTKGLDYHYKVTDSAVGSKSVTVNRSNLSKYLAKSQTELPERSMKDSYLVGIIPLSTNPTLQNQYVQFIDHVRVGRLLEDMDIFAVIVAEKHIYNPNVPEGTPTPETLVTALVDRIDFTDYIPKVIFTVLVRSRLESVEGMAHADIKISGHVSWVGTTSMEVVVWLEQQAEGKWNRITRALFLIAARDPTNTKSAIVNPIIPANDREKQILTGGESRKQARKLAITKHVTKVIPDHEEQNLIHDLYMSTKFDKDISLKKRTLPPDSVWMEKCTLSNIILLHPENRNFHNTVFGGFIMRQATELSWVLGYRFSKQRPFVKSISDINFNRPIAVNSLLQLHAHVVYTYLNYIQIAVYVETYDPKTGKDDTTNTFHFTYQTADKVKNIIPTTYHEAMMYIDGRRHFLEVIKLNGLKDSGNGNKSKL